MSTKLVTYFSASGVTAQRAVQLAQVTGADLFQIVPSEMYSQADLDWTDTTSRSTVEMNDPASRPAIDLPPIDFSPYDTIYLGYPIWWGLAPREINTFVEAYDLSGKHIVPFATSGGTGIEKSVAELQKTYPNLDIAAGTLLNDKVTGDIA